MKKLDFRELKALARENTEDILIDIDNQNYSKNDELNEFIKKTKSTIVIMQEVERILLSKV